MDLHNAIIKLNSSVVTIRGDIAYDKDNNIVEYNLAAAQNLVSSVEYKSKRRAEYPSIGDQLDALFHAGVFPAEMAAKIQAVKDKYPKSE